VALNSRGRAHARRPTRSNKRRTPRISRNGAPGSRAGPTPRADPIALRLCAEQVGQTGPQHRGRERNQTSPRRDRQPPPFPSPAPAGSRSRRRRPPRSVRQPRPGPRPPGCRRRRSSPSRRSRHSGCTPRRAPPQTWPETGHSNLPYDDGGNGSCRGHKVAAAGVTRRCPTNPAGGQVDHAAAAGSCGRLVDAGVVQVQSLTAGARRLWGRDHGVLLGSGSAWVVPNRRDG
jgi:hypothetical protein